MSTMFNRNRKGQQLVGQRHDGPNWVLIAGGAVVTVISFVIGRRESISKGGGLEKRKDNYRHVPKPDSKKGIAYLAAAGEKRIQTKYNGHQSDSHVDGASTPPTSHFQIHRTKSCKQEIHSASLPSSPKPFKETSMTPTCTDEDLQCSSRSPVSLRRVTSEKFEVVHRLQQQLKRRDGMIFDLQARIIDQGHTAASRRAHIANLEVQLEEKSKILFDSTQEVQRLQRALADQSIKCDACSGPDCSGFDDREVVNSLHMEVETLAGEVERLEGEKRELAEEVAHLECRKRERELVAQAMSQEHENLVQRVFKLQTELEKARKSALEKDCLFEVRERDQMEKTNSCCDHKHKLEAQKKRPEEDLHSLERKLVEADNTNSGGLCGGNNELHSSRKSHAKALSSRIGMVNSSSHHTGRAARTHSTTFKRSDDSNHTVSKFKAGSRGRQQVETRGSSNGQEETVRNTTGLDPAPNETFKPPQPEVQQLATALAIQPNMVSKKEMTRLVDDFQASDNIEDDVKEHMDTRTPMRLNSDKANWAELCRHFSFSTGVTSPAQVKELAHKLEQVEKQQQVEEEMAELKKHQTKIAELKQRVGKLSAKFQLWYNSADEDKVRDQHTLQVAALVLELTDRRAAQEWQTSIQEQFDSAEMTPHANGDANQNLSSYITQDKRPRENCATSFDHSISFTSAEEATRPIIDDTEPLSMPSQLAEEPHSFPVATSGRPASKIKNLFSNGGKKTTSRKSLVGHGSGREYVIPNRSSDSRKNSSCIEHMESNGFHTDTRSSDSGATSLSHQGPRKYSAPESKRSLGGKSPNMAADQKLSGHRTRSVEEEISLLSLEIEQVMAETSSLPLLSHLHQDQRFSPIMKSLAVLPVESTMGATDSRSSRASSFKQQGNYGNDGEFLVDPPHSRGKRFAEDEEEGDTEEDEISSSSRNYNRNLGHRIQRYPESPPTLLPFSETAVACLDSKKPLSTASLQASETFSKEIPIIFPSNSSKGGEVPDSRKAHKISIPQKTAVEKETSPGSSGSSIDAAFNEILDDTLEDLVKVCSIGTSLAGTPLSSVFSQGSVSKHAQQHY